MLPTGKRPQCCRLANAHNAADWQTPIMLPEYQMPLMPPVPGAFLLVAAQWQSEHPHYFPFDAFSIPSPTISRLLISESRRIDSLTFSTPSDNIASLDLRIKTL